VHLLCKEEDTQEDLVCHKEEEEDSQLDHKISEEDQEDTEECHIWHHTDLLLNNSSFQDKCQGNLK